MQGFTERQLEQLREVVKEVIVQLKSEESRQITSLPLEEVQKIGSKIVVGEDRIYEYQWAGKFHDYDFADFVGDNALGWVSDSESQSLIRINYPDEQIEVNAKVGDWLFKIDGKVYKKEPKPKISEHLYNNGRFRCCCEVCDCGEPELKDSLSPDSLDEEDYQILLSIYLRVKNNSEPILFPKEKVSEEVKLILEQSGYTFKEDVGKWGEVDYIINRP